MFTGIIETTGTIESVESHAGNKTFFISSPITPELKVDQSVSHEGVCLTIENISGNTYQVTAIAETLEKTNLSSWSEGRKINLERCMQLNGRLDGHIVQGHVDGTGTCIHIADEQGSWLYRFQFDPAHASLVIEKGSITVNGTSLTCFNVQQDRFEVAIIPYTYEHTSIHQVKLNNVVNLEFDVIGKYVQRIIATSKTQP